MKWDVTMCCAKSCKHGWHYRCFGGHSGVEPVVQGSGPGATINMAARVFDLIALGRS